MHCQNPRYFALHGTYLSRTVGHITYFQTPQVNGENQISLSVTLNESLPGNVRYKGADSGKASMLEIIVFYNLGKLTLLR